jgi:hypothetical protein
MLRITARFFAEQYLKTKAEHKPEYQSVRDYVHEQNKQWHSYINYEDVEKLLLLL